MPYPISRARRGMISPYRRGAMQYARIAGQVAGALYRNRGQLSRAAKFAAKRLSRKKARQPPRRKASTRKNTKKNQEQDKRLNKLSKQVDQATGHLTFRKLQVMQVLTQATKQKMRAVIPYTVSDLESVLAQCKYFNPATPGTLTTGSQASGTYSRTSLFDSVTMAMNIRNNYQSDISLKLYLCTNKEDTAKSVETAITDSVADNYYGAVTGSDDAGCFISDLALVHDLYKVKQVMSKRLKSGQEVTYSHSVGPFSYDSATVDSHNLAYQKAYKSFQVLVVIRGCLAHDPIVANQVGSIEGGVDVRYDTIFKVSYNAGINIKYCFVDNLTTGSSNGFVQSQKPIVDNQPYSIP